MKLQFPKQWTYDASKDRKRETTGFSKEDFLDSLLKNKLFFERQCLQKLEFSIETTK
jgi:hypothetical protein